MRVTGQFVPLSVSARSSGESSQQLLENQLRSSSLLTFPLKTQENHSSTNRLPLRHQPPLSPLESLPSCLWLLRCHQLHLCQRSPYLLVLHLFLTAIQESLSSILPHCQRLNCHLYLVCSVQLCYLHLPALNLICWSPSQPEDNTSPGPSMPQLQESASPSSATTKPEVDATPSLVWTQPEVDATPGLDQLATSMPGLVSTAKPCPCPAPAKPPEGLCKRPHHR